MKKYRLAGIIFLGIVSVFLLLMVLNFDSSGLSEVLDTPLAEVSFWHLLLGLLWIGILIR